jgi:flagellar basal-body rod modification protein FlgD
MSTGAIQSNAAGDAAAALASTPATSSATALSQSPQASQSLFLQLLVAQLKNQDPANPADGTQLVTQLAQFTTLEQTTQSRSDLDQILKAMQTAAAATATSSPATISSTQP